MSGPAVVVTVAGAGGSSVRHLLAAPVRPGRVLACFPSAVYVEVPGAPPPRIVALVAADGLRLPGSLVIGTPSAARPFAAVRLAAEVGVGGCGVTVGALAVRVARWWAPLVPRPPVSRPALGAGVAALAVALRESGARLPPSLGAATVAFAIALATGDRTRALLAADAVLGRGPGLTPSGDDVLCGVLLALLHLAPGSAADVRSIGTEVAARAESRTTALSAALLAHAARGESLRQAIDVVDAASGHSDLDTALPALLRVGHTSGQDLALGLLTGAREAAHATHRPVEPDCRADTDPVGEPG